MSEETVTIPAQRDVDDEVLALVVRDDDRAPAPAPPAVRGELVAPAEELVDAFVTTLVASPQTQRTYTAPRLGSCPQPQSRRPQAAGAARWIAR